MFRDEVINKVRRGGGLSVVTATFELLAISYQVIPNSGKSSSLGSNGRCLPLSE